jgi:hypothetical protein
VALASSLVRRTAANIVLDRVESGDVIERLARGGRSRGGMDVEELAPDVRPAGDLGDLRTIKPVEPGDLPEFITSPEEANRVLGGPRLGLERDS